MKIIRKMEKKILFKCKTNLKDKLKDIMKLNFKFYKNINFGFQNYLNSSLEYVIKNKNNLKYFTKKNVNNFRFRIFNLYENNIFVNYNKCIIFIWSINIFILIFFNYKIYDKTFFTVNINYLSAISIIFYIIVIILERFIYYKRCYYWYNLYNFNEKKYNKYKKKLKDDKKLKLFFYIKFMYYGKSLLKNKSKFKNVEYFESKLMIKKLILTLLCFFYSLFFIFFIVPFKTNFKNKHFNIYINWFLINNFLYFIFSVIQIKNGNSLNLSMFKEVKNINYRFKIKFFLMNTIPFVKEINMIIKFFASNTCLNIWEWLKIEDIKNELRYSRINENRILRSKMGEKLGIFYKTFLGILFGFSLYFILILPIVVDLSMNFYYSSKLLPYLNKLDINIQINLIISKHNYIKKINFLDLKKLKEGVENHNENDNQYIFNFNKQNDKEKLLLNMFPEKLKNKFLDINNLKDLKLKWDLEFYSFTEDKNNIFYKKTFIINDTEKILLVDFFEDNYWKRNKESQIINLFSINKNWFMDNLFEITENSKDNKIENDCDKINLFMKIDYNYDDFNIFLIEEKNEDKFLKLIFHINNNKFYQEILKVYRQNKSVTIAAFYFIIIVWIGIQVFKNKFFNQTHKMWSSEIVNSYKIINLVHYLEYMRVKGDLKKEKKYYYELIELFRDPLKLKNWTGNLYDWKKSKFD